MMNRIVTSVLALSLGACAVGPDYRPPEIAPDTDDTRGWLATEGEAAALPDSWWESLDDQQLTENLELAATQNYDIGIAMARIDEVRALRRAARSAFWPAVTFSGSRTSFEQSIESPGAGGTLIDAGLIERDVDFYTTSLDASWELDLFGMNRRRAESAAAQLQATTADASAVYLAVLAETASAYFELRGAEERLAIARRNIASQERTLDLTRRKVDAGLARRVDQLRAQAQLDSAKARVPSLRAAYRASGYRLDLLTGQPPAARETADGDAGPWPLAPANLSVGMRADVLRRRPDVAAAERRLAAATADIGVAQADFFPRLALNASYGFEAESSTEIGGSRARTSALVPLLNWPVFQGGRLRANLRQADARARGAAIGYEKSVNAALLDAETALSNYAEELAAYASLETAASASLEAADIAQRLYEQGLADFLTVLDAEQRRDEAQDALSQSRTRSLLNMVRVYKALGGGWDTGGAADRGMAINR